MSWFKTLSPIVIALCCTIFAAPKANAGSVSDFISGPGTAIYLGTGVTLPLLTDGKSGGQHALRTLDSLVTSGLICEGLKQVIHVKRPDNNGNDSFPSCHATAAFAIAAMQSHYHPRYALLWYAGASVIAYSRVDLNRHRWTDVLAGAGIGYLTGRLELKQKHGLILFPIISGDGNGGRIVGLQVMRSF